MLHENPNEFSKMPRSCLATFSMILNTESPKSQLTLPQVLYRCAIRCLCTKNNTLDKYLTKYLLLRESAVKNERGWQELLVIFA